MSNIQEKNSNDEPQDEKAAAAGAIRSPQFGARHWQLSDFYSSPDIADDTESETFYSLAAELRNAPNAQPNDRTVERSNVLLRTPNDRTVEPSNRRTPFR